MQYGFSPHLVQMNMQLCSRSGRLKVVFFSICVELYVAMLSLILEGKNSVYIVGRRDVFVYLK